MLETIREYARERLSEHEAAAVARNRHAEYFLAGAEANCGDFFGDLTRNQVDWFDGEHDNLRAALDRLREQESRPELELRLVVACHKFWEQRGHWAEGRQHLEVALKRADEAPAWLNALVLVRAAELAWRQGDYDRGKSMAEEALAFEDDLGESAEIGAHMMLAICESLLGNPGRAAEIYELVTARARAAGNETVVATVLNNLGNQALTDGDFTRARAYVEESAVTNRRLGEQMRLANNLIDLGFLALAENRLEEAAAAFRESMGICLAERYAELLVWVVEGLAAVTLERDAPIEATRLLAATTRPRAELGIAASYYPIGEETRERTLDAARGTLGEAEFAAAWAEGEALSVEEAAEKAALVH
jgi:tetratricopeptide (TPR) repeat protein